MKFGVVVFPGSNCDRDMQEALQNDLNQEVIMLWHKDKDINMFSSEDCIILPGGFSYGDYLRCGAIARFSPMMQSVIRFAEKGEGCLAFAMDSRFYVKPNCCPEYYCETSISSSFARIFTSPVWAQTRL